MGFNSAFKGLISALDGAGGYPTPAALSSGNGRAPIVQGAEWIQGAVRTDVKNLAPKGIRSPERPHLKTLCRLSYSGPHHRESSFKKLFEQYATENSWNRYRALTHASLSYNVNWDNSTAVQL